MFSGSTNGTLFPPYILYKVGNVYDSGTESGPLGAVYNRSKSGWFICRLFRRLVHKDLLYFNKFDKDANKVLIGEQHFKPHNIDKYKNNIIKFVLLLLNSKTFRCSFFQTPKDKGVLDT